MTTVLYLDVGQIARELNVDHAIPTSVIPRKKGPWYLAVYKPMTKLSLIQGGQSARQYTTRINQPSDKRSA